MRLRKGDEVVVIAGRDKGKTGTISRVMPKDNKVVAEGLNVAKRHTKPSDKHPRGGILELNRPIDVSKVMVVDPVTKQPSRIGTRINKDGTKEREFKPSRYQKVKKS